MKKKFNTYNDGVIIFGVFREVLDKSENIMKKEFIEEGKLFFSYSTIREVDKFKFNTDLKSEIKLKTIKNPILDSNKLIKLDNKYYEIEHIDKSKTELFIFIYDFVDKMNELIDIERKVSSEIDDNGIQFESWDKICTKFANVKQGNYKNTEFEHLQGTVILDCKEFIFNDCDINSLDRIIYNNRIYEIISNIDKDKNEGFISVIGVYKNG